LHRKKFGRIIFTIIVPAAMKKTLYQILGVGPKASAEEIAAAYEERVQELIFATIQDPNKALVLQQAKEILLDPRQRESYDVSIAAPSRPASRPLIDQEPAARILQSPGKWIIPGLLIIAAVVWWARRDASPPTAPIAVIEQADTQMAAERTSETAPPVEPVAPTPVKEAAAPPSAAIPEGEPAADSTVGLWSCLDPLSGRTDRYNFQADASLIIDAADGPQSFNYKISGSVLTLTDPKQTRIFRIEESTPRKMLLHTGAEGRRLVCTR
jgi:hypothetical protein